MNIFLILGCVVLGVGLTILLLSLRSVRMRMPAWLQRALGETPWAPGLARHMRATGEKGQPTHEVFYVPRQDIAECGVACPKCGNDVAERGDFSRIVRSMVDGQVNEVLKCTGLIDPGDGTKPVPCPAWLAASPNTEHGDDLIDGDPPEFYLFSRISTAQMLREKYGLEIGADDAGLIADPKARPEGSIPSATIPDFPSYRAAVEAAQAAERADSAVASLAGVSDQQVVRPFAEDDTRILPIITDPPKDT